MIGEVLHIPLSPSIGRVFFSDQGYLQTRPLSLKKPSSFVMTSSGVISTRHRLMPVSSHPALPQGRQSQFFLITRCPSPQGPHMCSPEGPKRATVGIFNAAAMCIGAVSTPKKKIALDIKAPSSLRLNSPPILIKGKEDRAVISFRKAFSASTGAQVKITDHPLSLIKYSATSAYPS